MTSAGLFSHGGAYAAQISFACGRSFVIRCRDELAGWRVASRASRRAAKWKARGLIYVGCHLRPI